MDQDAGKWEDVPGRSGATSLDRTGRVERRMVLGSIASEATVFSEQQGTSVGAERRTCA